MNLNLYFPRWKSVAAAMLALAILGQSACKTKTPTGTDQATLSTNSFLGPWVASGVDIQITSKNGSAADDVLHFDSKKLAADKNRQPTMTIFNVDGSYREDDFNLHDSLIQSRNGFWHYYADSLYMRLDVETSPKIAFRTALEGKGLKLMSKVDWDGDGAKDDLMVIDLKRP